MFYLNHHVKLAYGKEETYVLDAVAAAQRSMVCLSTSAQVIKCYDIRTAGYVRDLVGHNNAITDMALNPVDSNIVASSQMDTGVMISDLRLPTPVNYLTELQSSGTSCHSLTFDDSGTLLAIAVGGDIHLVDARTWKTAKCFMALHSDEISRLRFCGGSVMCSGGEDFLLNFIDISAKEDDMMLSVINWGEAASKISFFPQYGVTAITGSCENSLIVPMDMTTKETKILRPDYETYVVDFVDVGLPSNLGLLLGSKTEDGQAGDLQVVDPVSFQSVASLRGGHDDIVRVVLSFLEGPLFITGAEDGTVAWWSTEAPSSHPSQQKAPSEMKMRSRKPY